MKLKEKQRDFLRAIGNFLLPYFVDLLLMTVKIVEDGKELPKENFVAAFWHGKMLIGWKLLSRRNPAALVSESKDGELLTKVLRHWKYELARGSSSKGGKDALEILVRKAKDGFTIGITPDGPRGPAKKFKAGAVIIAKRSLKPLVLIGIGFQKSVRLKSWDAFEIPKPFSRVYVKCSEPMYYEENLSYEETSEAILKAEEELNKINKEAEEYWSK
jgi:lysophospholipid acyltransferase (LPLAT)-like uncharacterized protein